jgi:hypothetical protein
MIAPRVRQLLFELGLPPTNGPEVPVFIFSSAELRHVWIALERRLWAVSTIDPDQLRGRITKARRMPLGANGLFYCSDAKCFTAPFKIQSRPELTQVEDVWPGTWHFPFEIDPLGNLGKRISLRKAKATWKTLEGTRNVTTRINISGSMAFVPSWLYEEDWESILGELGSRPSPVRESDS